MNRPKKKQKSRLLLKLPAASRSPAFGRDPTVKKLAFLYSLANPSAPYKRDLRFRFDKLRGMRSQVFFLPGEYLFKNKFSIAIKFKEDTNFVKLE